MLEMIDDIVLADALKIKTLTAAQNRDRNLLRLGGREDKMRMRRRLFKRLQQGVKRLVGEHMNLVNNIDLIAVPARRVAHPLAKLANLIDAAVRRPVDLKDVGRLPLVDLFARRALIAGRGGRALGAVKRLGQNPRGRGLTDTAGAAKKIRMRHAVLVDRVDQRARDMLLAHDLFKKTRTPLSGEDYIRHFRPGFEIERAGRARSLHLNTSCT